MEKERMSNIELLRILASVGVVLLHYYLHVQSTIAGMGHLQIERINEIALTVLRMVSISAVDLFVLISGYFLVNSLKRNWWKPIRLLAQVSVFRGGVEDPFLYGRTQRL